MKKILNILTVGLLILFFVMAFLPTYNQLYFYTKHISLYLFLALLSIRTLLFFYKRIVSNNSLEKKKVNILQLFTLLFLVGTLYLVGEIQLGYIDLTETPQLQKCTYYDDYNNLVYASQFSSSTCPELEDITLTDTTFSFSVRESSIRYWSGQTENGVVIPAQNLFVERLTEISIVYTTNHEVKEFIIVSSTNIGSDSDGRYTNKYYSIKREIFNTYNANSFESIYDSYTYEEDNYSFDSLENVLHYNFTEEDRVRKIVSSCIEYDSNNEGTITLSILTDSDLEARVFGIASLSTINHSQYNTLIDLEIQEGSGWIFVGNHYKTYIGYNSVLKHNNFYDSDNAYVEYYYSNTNGYDSLLTQDIYQNYEYIRDDIYTIYKNSFQNMDIIESKFNLNTIEKYDYGYIVKEYHKSDGCLGGECDYYLQQVDWLYWNSIGPKLITMYDYESLIHYRNLDNYIFDQDNPLISIYYD